MRAAPRFNKCSTQCAVDYRIRIGFEYQSVSFLAYYGEVDLQGRVYCFSTPVVLELITQRIFVA